MDSHKLTSQNINEISDVVSSTELHVNKPKMDNDGNYIFYCDNPACQKIIVESEVIIDKKTGGLYHNELCYEHDMNLKLNKAHSNKNFEFTKITASLDDATFMYKTGKLQQSPNPTNWVIENNSYDK